MTDLDALHAAVTALSDFAGLARRDLAPLPAKGVAHDHVRLGGTWLARLPRFSQWGLEPEPALAYEAAAFARAAPSGHTPDLLSTLPVGPALPRGALIVRHVDGRPPRLPDDLPALAEALAAIHRLPPPAEHAPLKVHDDPVRATLAVIEEQAAYLPRAGLDPATRDAVAAELDWARGPAKEVPRSPPCLVGTDTHPGNFLIDSDGRAWFVDLEKALYGAAAIDLAHATLATSTAWDPDVATCLERDAIRRFYTDYLAQAPDAAVLRPGLLPLRRLTWLRTITWFARWRADWAANKGTAARDPALAAHIARVVGAALTPAAVMAVRAEWLGPNPLAPRHA